MNRPMILKSKFKKCGEWQVEPLPANETIECEFLEECPTRTRNSNSISLSGDGTSASKLKADVKISANTDNILTVESDGLLAKTPPCLVETTTSTSIKASDSGKLWIGTANTLTMPTGLPVGFRLDIKGAVTVAVPSGKILNSEGGKTDVVAEAGATLIKISSTSWWLAGALE